MTRSNKTTPCLAKQLQNDITKLHKVLGDIEKELRRTGTQELGFWATDRDKQLQTVFLKMADSAKQALDQVNITE